VKINISPVLFCGKHGKSRKFPYNATLRVAHSHSHNLR